MCAEVGTAGKVTNDVPGDVLFHGKHTACGSNPGLLTVVYTISLYTILLFFVLKLCERKNVGLSGSTFKAKIYKILCALLRVIKPALYFVRVETMKCGLFSFPEMSCGKFNWNSQILFQLRGSKLSKICTLTPSHCSATMKSVHDS